MRDLRYRFIKQAEPDDQSAWEIWLFAIAFVLVFFFVARSQANEDASLKKSVPTKSSVSASTPGSGTSGAAVSPTITTNKTASSSAQVDSSAVVSLPTENATTSLSTSLATAEFNQAKWKFGGKGEYEIAQTINRAEPTSYSGSYGLTLAATHNPTKIGVKAATFYVHEYSYEKDDGTIGELLPTSVSASKSFEKPMSWLDTFGVSLGGTIPTGREAERNRQIGALGPTLSIARKISRLSLSQTLGYSYRWYEYDIRDDGRVLSPHLLRHITSIGFEITDKFSVNSSLDLRHTRSFQNVVRSSSVTSFSLDYDWSEKVALSLGVSTEKSTLANNGQSNSVTFFDVADAQAGFSIGMSF